MGPLKRVLKRTVEPGGDVAYDWLECGHKIIGVAGCYQGGHPRRRRCPKCEKKIPPEFKPPKGK